MTRRVIVAVAVAAVAWLLPPAPAAAQAHLMPLSSPGCSQMNVLPVDVATDTFPHRPHDATNVMIRHMGPDNLAAAWQSGCGQVSVAINSRTFDPYPVAGGGPHVMVERLFAAPPPAFPGGAGLVMQGWFEVPFADTTAAGVAQLAMVLNLEDRTTGRAFSWVVGIWDTRWADYRPFVRHDLWRRFVSQPLTDPVGGRVAALDALHRRHVDRVAVRPHPHHTRPPPQRGRRRQPLVRTQPRRAPLRRPHVGRPRRLGDRPPRRTAGVLARRGLRRNFRPDRVARTVPGGPTVTRDRDWLAHLIWVCAAVLTVFVLWSLVWADQPPTDGELRRDVIVGVCPHDDRPGPCAVVLTELDR